MESNRNGTATQEGIPPAKVEAQKNVRQSQRITQQLLVESGSME